MNAERRTAGAKPSAKACIDNPRLPSWWVRDRSRSQTGILSQIEMRCNLTRTSFRTDESRPRRCAFIADPRFQSLLQKMNFPATPAK